MSLATGARLGPYEVVSLLGSGGMGEVYRARDTKLDRDVAIKVLPESVAADPDILSRFEREAKAVAALSHPNILSIFDFGTHGSVSYAVTELLEGETLRSKLESGPIQLRLAVDYALQIAKGLSAAHGKGIVHRDLKPENLFISKDDHVKILDFGLAKHETSTSQGSETGVPTASRYTEPGTVVGTVGYMSPEQVRGLHVDHRSDIFSFGAILYEMLSGRRAFKGDTAADTMAAIMKEEPPEIAQSGHHISAALDHIIKRCLAKKPADRFQSARDLVFSLAEAPVLEGPASGSWKAAVRSWSPIGWRSPMVGLVAVAAIAVVSFLAWRGFTVRGRAAPQTVTAQSAQHLRLVVLPFENLGAPEDAYFAAGMTEEIINRLANLQGLSVISRTTAIGYDRKGKTIRQIGSDLGVDFVLEGTVRWERGAGSDSRLRITPELIKVADDTQLWGDQYDRVMADVFIVQSEVAENVVRALGMKLVPRERTALAAASTRNIDAYDFYLRGLEFARRGHAAADQEAGLRMFQAAVDRDPRFPQALAELAKAHLSLYFYFGRLQAPPDRSHVESARKVLEVLSAIGAELPDLRVARGYYTYWGFDKLEPALVDFRAALTLQPSNIPALSGALFVLRRQGQWDQAAELASRLVELDPQDAEILQQSGMTLLPMRRYADADGYYARSTRFNRQYGIAWAQWAWLETMRGDAQKALQHLTEARSVEHLLDDSGWIDHGAIRARLLMRDFPGALREIDVMTRDAVNTQWYFIPVETLRGDVYAASGQPQLARPFYDAARRRMEGLTAKAPGDSRYHSALGIAYAGIGHRTEALREAEAGIALMPTSTDAWRHMWRLQDLARVQAMLGDADKTLETLDALLSGATELSAPLVRIDPRWDFLKGNPRFQTLLAKYGDKP